MLYDVAIDALPYVGTQRARPKHAYITFSRLLKRGFTKKCHGCDIQPFSGVQTKVR